MKKILQTREHQDAPRKVKDLRYMDHGVLFREAMNNSYGQAIYVDVFIPYENINYIIDEFDYYAPKDNKKQI